jgi:hypothetical protein
MKVKNIKSKVAAKVAKGKKKVAAKCGKKACAAIAALVALALAGCGTTTPSRSQTLTFDDCTFNIYGGGADTNDVARVEIGSQAMAIDTSGTETQTATPSYTTDVKPDIDVSVPVTKTPAAKVAEAAASLVGECVGGACSK